MNFIKNFFAKFKVKNKSAFRHGSYAVAIIAVVIAGVIVLNVLMGILSQRGVLSFDITADKANSMSEENIEFLKTVDKPVSVTMLSTAEAYTGGTMNEFSSNYLYVVDDSNYYSQTINILNQYSQINSNITVVYEDFYGAKTENIATEYSNLFYGDILVEYTNSKGEKKSRLVTFDDIYTYSDETGYAAQGYGYYYVDGNNIETALSSAINILISEETKQLAIVASHSNTSVFTTLYKKALELNGFEISEISNPIIQSIPEEIDVLVITAPTTDFLQSEINVISDWLWNDGYLSKSLIFVPGASMKKFPVLTQFLAEWGIEYSEGLLYQTDKNYYYGNPTSMYMFAATSDLTKDIAPSSSGLCLLSSNLVMNAGFDTYASRKTNIIVSTNDAVTVAPEGASENWEPAKDAECNIYPGLIVTNENNFVDNVQYKGYVAAFSTQEFIYSTWADNSNVQNMDFALNTAIFVSGMDTSKMSFVPKTISTQSFASMLSESEVIMMQIIFMAVVPLVIVTIGVVVWVRRKRR